MNSAMAWLEFAVAVLCVALSSSIEYNEETAAMFDDPSSITGTRRKRTTEHQSLFLNVTCEEAGIKRTRLTDEQKQWILDYHNARRQESGSSNMDKMEWDEDLACQAQRVVDSCQWGHNDIRAREHGKMQIGQNIVATYVGKDLKDVDKDRMEKLNKYYYDEKKHYVYPDTDCEAGFECNHYRMMMISKNNKIGGACGICNKKWRKDKGEEDLTKKKSNVLFCVNNYNNPLSSIRGGKLFEKGKPCSHCAHTWARCENNLCVKCEKEQKGCKFFGNCKDRSTQATCAFVHSEGKCEGFRGLCDKTCGHC